MSAAWPINWLNFYAKCFLRVRQIEKYLRILLLLFKLSFKGVKIRSSITTKLLFKSISMESIKVSVSDGNSLSTVSCLHRSKSIVAPFFVPLLSTYNDFCLYSYISFIIIVYRVDKDLGKFICNFYSLLGPGFFLKKCLIFVTLGTVDVLDVNASVYVSISVCQSFFLLLHSISILNFGLCCWPGL